MGVNTFTNKKSCISNQSEHYDRNSKLAVQPQRLLLLPLHDAVLVRGEN